MSRKIRFDKNDFDRVLITETLPAEVPLIFSNDNFYDFVKNKQSTESDPLLKQLFSPGKPGYTIPYVYSSTLNGSKKRQLSLLHPSAQLDVRDFYLDYFSVLLDRCSLSQASLRYPARQATGYYEGKRWGVANELRTDEVESEFSSRDMRNKYASSFYVYKPFGRLHEFYDSHKFIDLEKRYNFLRTLDISKCFYNIYTHTIAWAVKDRTYAKRSILKKSFESDFDKLIQSANYSETNGIPVGPEVCRLFAEVILQDIDLKVIDALSSRDLHWGVDYEFYRYIDDYFLFTHNEVASDAIEATIQDELAFYKLYLNTSKSETFSRPFSTGKSRAIDSLSVLADKVFNDLAELTTANNYTKQRYYRFRSQDEASFSAKKTIQQYRAIAAEQGLSYSDVSSFFLGAVRYRLLMLSRRYVSRPDRDKEYEAFIRALILIAKVTFFVLSTDIRSRTVDTAGQTLVIIRDLCKSVFSREQPLRILEETIQVEFAGCFLRNGDHSVASNYPLEFSSCLIIVYNVSSSWRLAPHILEEFWNSLKISNYGFDTTQAFPYFEAVSLLHFAKDRQQYAHLRQLIVRRLVAALKRPYFNIDTACTLAVLDCIACPYLTAAQRDAIAMQAWQSVFQAPPSRAAKVNAFRNRVAGRYWFVDWSDQLNIRKALFKKEWRTSY